MTDDQVKSLSTALENAFGVSKSSPAFLEAIAMQLGMSSGPFSGQSIPSAITEAGRTQADAMYAIAEAISELASAIKGGGK
jgi:hypothetical protein